MKSDTFYILAGLLTGCMYGLALTLIVLIYINTDTQSNCHIEPVQQEMTMEEKIEKYKQFDQTHPADSLFFEQRYSTPTITGTLL